MILKEKERTVIQDLQTQEKSCIEKYGKYAQQARDPELKSLFQTLQKKEQEHYDSLSQVLSGTVPQVNCNDSDGRDYQPKAAYTSVMSSEDKEHDAFLATDCIGTEKLISGEYNSDVFAEEASGRYPGGRAESCGDALQIQDCERNVLIYKKREDFSNGILLFFII